MIQSILFVGTALLYRIIFIPPNSKILTDQQIEYFEENGVIVVPRVLDLTSVAEIRNSLHDCLKAHSCDIENLLDTAGSLEKLSSTNGAGGILDIFYQAWKLKVNEDPRIVKVIQYIWEKTYAKCKGIWKSPFGPFDSSKGFMYIDRVGFRLPDHISQFDSSGKKRSKRGLQRTLAPHLDCCPHNMFASHKAIPKWRPIQAFLCLTDTTLPNHGGFEACLGFHKVIETWAKVRPWSASQDDPRPRPPVCIGDFTPFRPKEDKEIFSSIAHIPCKAGDLVVWDYRIPHSNSLKNIGSNSREVVYIGLLPDIPRNKKYAEDQLKRYYDGLLPTDQWHEETRKEICNYNFSTLGKKLMTIENW